MNLILGAGVTGLSFARFSSEPCVILEKDRSVGGYCKTTKRNGFVWDYSGHFFHFRHPDIKELVTQNIPQSELVSVLKDTKIYYKGKLIEYPFQKNIHQLEKDELIDCLYDLFASRNGEVRNFKEMLYQKFGRSIAEKFLIPYNEKLYACDLNTLDKDAMGRFFPYAEKEEIVLNFKGQENHSYNETFTYPKGGAIEYIHALARDIPEDSIRLNTEIVAIDSKAHTAHLSDGTSIRYDRLISTVPFPKLLDLCQIPYEADTFSWNKVLVFNLGFDKKGINKKTHWIYFPHKEFCFYRVGFYDNILNSDRMSLYVELGFSKHDAIHPNEYLGRVLADLKQAGIIAEDQVLTDYESIIMDPAYVHINETSLSEVSRFKQLLADADIYSIGRYGSWTYCSIEDNILEARALAKQLQHASE